MPRVNGYPQLASPAAENDVGLGYDVSADQTVKAPFALVANLARGTWARTVATAGLGSLVAVPWEAASQRLDEILTGLPAALTVDVHRLDGSTVTVTRTGGAWVANGGATVITPGCPIQLRLGAGNVTVTCRLTGMNRPTTLVVPATAVPGSAVYVTNPLRRTANVRALFVDVDLYAPAGLTVNWYASASSMIQWIHPAEGGFQVQPGAVLAVYFSGTPQNLTLTWNDEGEYIAARGASYGAEGTQLEARNPTANDYVNIWPGRLWINTLTQAVFVCVARGASSATWKEI